MTLDGRGIGVVAVGELGTGAASRFRAAQEAVGDALDALRRAGALPWESPAGDAFRARLEDVVAGVRRDDGEVAVLRHQAWALEAGR